MDVDVVVIGAGFAGLCAARELRRAGRRVRLLEARDRVGGRSKAATLDGRVVDVGGQWIGPRQTRLAALAREFNVMTTPQYGTGRKVVDYGGRVRTYTGLVPRLPALGLIEVELALRAIKRMSARVPLDAPWSAPQAAEWDARTFEDLKRHLCRTRAARTVLDIATRAVFTMEPSELSLLYFLFYAASGGSFDELTSTAGGAQQDVFVGGAHQLAARMAEELGDVLTLAAPVRAIEQSDENVRVVTAAQTIVAQRAIVAMSPTLAGDIAYEPQLPVARDSLGRRMAMGTVIKALLAYETPFWRTAGFTGEAISDRHPFSPVFDASPADGSRGVLVGFFDGAKARHWSARGPAARREAAVASAVRYFGPRAQTPVAYTDNDWLEEPYSRGCYAANMGPRTMTDFGHALREPCGRIHWAGTETATVSCGYLDGALRSGDRVAAEVAGVLRRS